ncbi:MAG: DUF6754 domain-containing protein [Candidatus Latescibacterota bacterium]|nr:DUF6754 domain-containing protein [Candidatus Latescibacterota bacterium]
MRHLPDTLILFSLLLVSSVSAQAKFPTGLVAVDTPNDKGNSITLTLPHALTDDTHHRVMYAKSASGMFEFLAELEGDPAAEKPQTITVTKVPLPDGSSHLIENDEVFFFKVTTRVGNAVQIGGAVSAHASPNYFNTDHTSGFVFVITFSVLLFASIGLARRKDVKMRKLPGLEALDEALGRATEMGKSVLFIHGLQEINSASTIAAVNVLGQVARRSAQFDTELKVANRYPLTMSVSQEVVREACVEAGRPDAYNPDNVFLAAADQFSYAAALEGLMMREKPAANILMGYFYAESLLLTETGSRTGAIQIAGSDAYTQLPFFVTTCDYTLMGEELYAASAYLSRDARLLGSILAQDVVKASIVILILIGAVASAFGIDLVGAALNL